MKYEKIMKNTDMVDMYMIKWKPILDITNENIPPIDNVIIRMETAIMLQRTEDMYNGESLKIEIPRIRREFPLKSDSERIDIINEMAVQSLCAIQGMTEKNAKLYLGL